MASHEMYTAGVWHGTHTQREQRTNFALYFVPDHTLQLFKMSTTFCFIRSASTMLAYSVRARDEHVSFLCKKSIWLEIQYQSMATAKKKQKIDSRKEKKIECIRTAVSQTINPTYCIHFYSWVISLVRFWTMPTPIRIFAIDFFFLHFRSIVLHCSLRCFQ